MPTPRSWKFFPMFSSRRFIVLAVTFRSVFVIGIRQRSKFLFLLVQIPNYFTPLVKKTIFSHWTFSVPLSKIIWPHTYESIFGLYTAPLISNIYLYTNTTLSPLLWLKKSSWNQVLWFLFLFFPKHLVTLVSLLFHVSFWINLSISIKKPTGSFLGIALERNATLVILSMNILYPLVF